MRRTLLSVLVSLVIARVALCQPPVPWTVPDVPTGPSLQAELPAPNPQADEIQALKASMLQLQQRLDRLAPPPAANAPGQPAVLPAPATPWELPAPQAAFAGPVCPCPTGMAPAKVDSSSPWLLQATWNHGLMLESPDEVFRVHVGGRLQFDYGWNAASQAVQFGPGGTGEFQDGAYFRRARLRIDGTLYQHLEWVAEFDFANSAENDTGSSTQTIGTPSFADCWIAANDLPLLGTLRMGWMKEPFSFERLTSSRWLNFMERSQGIDPFLRSPGIMLRNETADQRVTWAAGFYHVQNNNFGFGIGDGQYAETGRLTWLPWYERDGSQLLHVGFGATHRHLNDNLIDVRGRPSVRTMPGVLEPPLAETGTIAGTTQEALDAELAGVYGPWTLQSEYFCTWVHDAVFPNSPPPQGVPRGTLFYQGAYVELLYFLTGEHRDYDRTNAVFDRVIPLRNFNVWGEEHGWGAWQVGIRYGYLDLQNKGVNGATLNDVVLGLNWFLNPNMKIQWNFAIDHRSSTPPGSSGWTYIFGSRLALDF
jgi:phosphate-selective porin OprO and OprP